MSSPDYTPAVPDDGLLAVGSSGASSGNLVDEISSPLAYDADWGAELIVPTLLATVIAPGAGAGVRLAGVRAT